MTKRLLIGLVAACALVGWGCGEEPEPPTTTISPPAQAPAPETTQVEIPKVEVPKSITPEVQALISRSEPLLAQAKQYIKDNKLELAKKAIDELMKYKTELPPALQEQIDALIKAFDAQKALGGLTLPG